MKDFIECIVKELVDFPNEVVVTETDAGKVVILEVKVNPVDVKKIIGKHGRTIMAMRALAESAAAKRGKRVVLEIIEPEGRVRPPQAKPAAVKPAADDLHPSQFDPDWTPADTRL